MTEYHYPITGLSLAHLPFDIATGTQVVNEALVARLKNSEDLVKASTRVVIEYYKLFRTKPLNVVMDYEEYLCGDRRKRIEPHVLWQAQIQAHMDRRWKVVNPVDGYNYIYRGCKFRDLDEFMGKCGQKPLAYAARNLKREWRIEREVAVDLLCKSL